MCNTFTDNFAKFNKIVLEHNRSNMTSILYIFVGGLAASATIRGKILERFEELKRSEERQVKTNSGNEFISTDAP